MKALALIILTLASSILIAQTKTVNTCQWPKLKKLKNGQEIKTYTFHFWDYVRKNFKSTFPSIANENGFVAGDFHFNNVTAGFNPQVGYAQLFLADSDDAGYSIQLADYIKYISFLKSIYSDLNEENILKAYASEVLNNETKDHQNDIPKKISHLLSLSETDFQDYNTNYVLRKLNDVNSRFAKKFDLSPITELSSEFKKIAAFTQKSLKSEGELLDSGYKINSSGSSIGMTRLLFLLKSKNNLNIFELKEQRCAAVEKMTPQTKEMKEFTQSTLKQIMNLTHIESQKITYPPRQFLLRKKIDNQIEKLEIEKFDKVDFQKYSEFFARILGLFHSGSSTDVYKKYLRTGLLKKAELISEFSKNYLTQLEADLKK